MQISMYARILFRPKNRVHLRTSCNTLLTVMYYSVYNIETEDKPSSLEKFLEVNSWEGGDGLKRFDAVSGKTVRTQTLSKYEEAR